MNHASDSTFTKWLAETEAKSPPPPNGYSFKIGERVRHKTSRRENGRELTARVIGRGSAFKPNTGEFSRELAYLEIEDPSPVMEPINAVLAEYWEVAPNDR